MQRAVDLAKLGIYSTKPNPAVGCVITHNNVIIGEGWHRQAGQLHAERLALLDAKQKGFEVAGATVYVTLEPCSHTGRTTPCSDALIDAKVARVVVAMQDPNPLVSGQGVHKLQSAGITVDVGLLESQAVRLNLGFIQTMKTKLPFVRLKMATSLDGRTAASNGESQWITGDAARREVHFMRAKHGALITGIGTVLADNPSMTVRLSDEELASVSLTQDGCHPIRVILDPNLSMPLDAKMLSMPGRTIVITSKESAEKRLGQVDTFYDKGIELVAVASVDDVLDLESVLYFLASEEKITDVMVEAGSIVAGGFIKAGLVNELHCFIAPTIMGEQAKPMFTIPGLEKMADKVQFSFQSCEMIGQDVHLVLTPSEPRV